MQKGSASARARAVWWLELLGIDPRRFPGALQKKREAPLTTYLLPSKEGSLYKKIELNAGSC